MAKRNSRLPRRGDRVGQLDARDAADVQQVFEWAEKWLDQLDSQSAGSLYPAIRWASFNRAKRAFEAYLAMPSDANDDVEPAFDGSNTVPTVRNIRPIIRKGGA